MAGFLSYGYPLDFLLKAFHRIKPNSKYNVYDDTMEKILSCKNKSANSADVDEPHFPRSFSALPEF
jgi:hypothetical protein